MDAKEVFLGPLERARRVLRRLLPGAALALAACSSAPRLLDETRHEPYASLRKAWEALPHEREAYEVRAGGGQPVRVALDVVRTPRGAARPVLVLQSGFLSDGSTWRFLVGALGGEVDTIAVDPPGSGLSDSPDPRTAGRDAYSPSWTAEHTLLALEAWERHRGVERAFVLVGHSLGGTAVLRMLADPALRARHGPLLGRVQGVVLFDPADIALEKIPKSAQDVVELTDLEAGLGSLLGVMRTEVARGVHANASDPSRDALAAEAARICRMLARTDQRRAAQAMLLRFGPVDACGRRDLEAARALAEQERGVRHLVLVFWGERDDTLPLRHSMLQRFPSRLETMKPLKHSGHQEAAEALGPVLIGWVDRVAAEPGLRNASGR